jgi:hypothetical protein
MARALLARVLVLACLKSFLAGIWRPPGRPVRLTRTAAPVQSVSGRKRGARWRRRWLKPRRPMARWRLAWRPVPDGARWAPDIRWRDGARSWRGFTGTRWRDGWRLVAPDAVDGRRLAVPVGRLAWRMAPGTVPAGGWRRMAGWAPAVGDGAGDGLNRGARWRDGA